MCYQSISLILEIKIDNFSANDFDSLLYVNKLSDTIKVKVLK